MALPDDTSLRPQVTTLRNELTLELPRAAVETTLIEAFTAELEVRFAENRPNDAERTREQELIGSFSVEG